MPNKTVVTFNQFLLGAAVGAGAVALGLLLAQLLKNK
jgi:hypothetical protein